MIELKYYQISYKFTEKSIQKIFHSYLLLDSFEGLASTLTINDIEKTICQMAKDHANTFLILNNSLSNDDKKELKNKIKDDKCNTFESVVKIIKNSNISEADQFISELSEMKNKFNELYSKDKRLFTYVDIYKKFDGNEEKISLALKYAREKEKNENGKIPVNIFRELYSNLNGNKFTIHSIKKLLSYDDYHTYLDIILEHCKKHGSSKKIPDNILKVFLDTPGIFSIEFKTIINNNNRSIHKSAKHQFRDYIRNIFDNSPKIHIYTNEFDRYFTKIAECCEKLNEINAANKIINEKSYALRFITRNDFNNLTNNISRKQCIIKKNFFSSWKIKNVGNCFVKINNTPIVQNKLGNYINKAKHKWRIKKTKQALTNYKKNKFFEFFELIKALIKFFIARNSMIQKSLNSYKLLLEYFLADPLLPVKLKHDDTIVFSINTYIEDDVCEEFIVKVRIQSRKSKVETPTVLQMEATECTAASLSIILGYLGRHEPLEKLRVECGVSRGGANFNSLRIAAKSYGLENVKHRHFSKVDSLYFINYPCFLYVIPRHCIVLEGMHNNKVYINDPGTGRRCITKDELDNIFMGHVIEFNPQESKVEKGGNKFSIIKEVKNLLKQDIPALWFVFLFGLLMILPGLAVPTFSRIFIDEYLLANKTYWFYPLLTAMLFTCIIHMVITGLQERFLLNFENKIAISKSSSFLNHLLCLPITFFTQRYPSGIASRLMLVEKVAEIVSKRLSVSIIELIAATVFFCCMIIYDLTLTLACCFWISINAILVVYLSKKISDASQKLLNDEEKLTSTAKNGLQMIETIKATGAENEFFFRWSGYHSKTLLREQTLAIYNVLLQTIPVFIKTMIMSTILVGGGYLIMQSSNFTIGMLVAFQSLTLSFNKPINNIVLFFNEFLQLHGYLTRIKDVFKHDIDEQVYRDLYDEEADQNLLQRHSKMQGKIELKNISFDYSPLNKAKPLIKDFNLEVQPGESVAIVGKSGSGKSTVAKLITGLYKPWNGEILFDGKSREEIPRFILSNFMGIVDQEVIIFDGTIIDNLTLWDNEIPNSNIISALRDAYIHQILKDRPNEFHTKIEEGGNNFSGGQRQRFEIARALVRHPKIIVLDEATSALDPHSEEIVSDNIKNRGCTIIIIAHRLSTIRDCDKIIVMENGKVREVGNHEELVKKKKIYYNLVSHQ